MSYTVTLSDDAWEDLRGIGEYIAKHDSPAQAQYVLDAIDRGVDSLMEMPTRGTYPRELSELGIHDFRELFFKPCRIIYEITSDAEVTVYVIADGRRDMRTLLEQRLLGA